MEKKTIEELRKKYEDLGCSAVVLDDGETFGCNGYAICGIEAEKYIAEQRNGATDESEDEVFKHAIEAGYWVGHSIEELVDDFRTLLFSKEVTE